MASSSTEICNLALKHIGVTKEISNIDSDRSNEGLSCRRFYGTVLDKALRDFTWPFATSFVTLGLVQQNPTPEWGYSYRYPSDCVRLVRILSPIRNDYRTSRASYKLGQDAQGTLIYTDVANANLEYTSRVTNALLYPADFVMAFSMLLGAYIAPGLTGGDPFKLRSSTMQLYEIEVSRARANAGNEEQVDDTPAGEFIRGRD